METLNAHGVEYTVVRNDIGDIVSLKEYDKKYKMWVTIKFSDNPNNIDNEIIDMLSEEYLKTIHS